VVIIGHLGRKYRAQDDGGLHDEGLRVLADEQIAYEADAILLVEREGDERTVTPIIAAAPGAPELNKRYAATLATLYPDLVPDADKAKPRAADKAKGRQGEGAHQQLVEEEPEQIEASRPPASAATTAATPPRDPVEAEKRFFTRYSEIVGGDSWTAVQNYTQPRPQADDRRGWIAAAEAARSSRQDSSPTMAA
jgi:hypothetical protein